MCYYCEAGLSLEQEIVIDKYKSTKKKENFNYEKCYHYYKKNQNSVILQKLEFLKEIEFHKQIAKRQRDSYDNYRTDPNFLGEDTILIEADYKEKIYFGKKSPRQISTDWFNYCSCSLLGFGIYYVDSKINKETGRNEKFINSVNIDLISDDTSQKAIDFIDKFRYLRTWKNLNQLKKTTI